MFVATDLHGHTYLSDGKVTPEEYVEFRRELGMRVIATADHDHFAACRRGATAARAANMMFLPAAEITSFFHFGKPEREQVHVLAYFAPEMLDSGKLESTFLYRRGLRVQAAWKAFVLDWLGTLDPADREAIDPEGKLESLPAADFPALQSTITLIVERCRARFDDFQKHHVHFWEDGAELFGWTPFELVEAIRGDGAIDIVAHPARYRDKSLTEELLQTATGLEVYTSRHKPEVAASYRAYAESNRKLWTASADDHQNAMYVRPVCGTPVATLERICRRRMPLSLLLAA